LRPEPHDEHHRLCIRFAKNLVADVDAVGASGTGRLVGDGWHGVSSRRFSRHFLAVILELYDTVCRVAEGNLAVTASACPDRQTLTVPSQGCGMAKKKGTYAPHVEEDADG
jgi:hypothetical protein